MKTRRMKLMLSASAVALSLALTGCGGGGGSPQSLIEQETPAQMQVKAITAAIEKAEMAVAALKDNTNPTQAQVDAANAAIQAVQDAISAATAVSDKSAYEGTVAELQGDAMAAQTLVTAAEEQRQLAETQRMQMQAIMEAITAAKTAVGEIDATNPTQAQVDAANEAVEAVEMAISAAGEGVDTSSYAMTVAELETTVTSARNRVANAGTGGTPSTGGGTPTTPGPTPGPGEQKDIATLIMEAETAVKEIHATNPTQAEVDAANTAIKAADDAIMAAEEAGQNVDMTDTDKVEALRPTVTMAEQRVTIITDINTAEMAVTGIPAAPTYADVETVNTLIKAADDAIEDATALDMAETDMRTEQVNALRNIVKGVEVEHAVTWAETAKDAAMAADEEIANDAAPRLSAFLAPQTTIAANMGVSEEIGEDAAVVATVEYQIDIIQGVAGTQTTPGVNDEGGTHADGASYLKIAEEAVANLEAEVTKLRGEKETLEGDLTEAQGKEANLQTMVDALQAEYDDLELDASYAADGVDKILQQIANLEADKISANPERLAELEVMIADIKMDVTTFEYDPPSATQAEQKTYSEYKMLKTSTREAADEKKTEHDGKQAELTKTQTQIMTLPTQIMTKETEITTKEADVTTAEGYVTEIKGVLNNLAPQLSGWKAAVGDDTAATESEKAGLVFALLRKPLEDPDYTHQDPDTQNAVRNSPLKAVTDVLVSTEELTGLDTADHVFARADKPAGTMTFKDIADGNEAWAYHRRSFIQAGTTDRVDTHAHTDTTGLPQNHPAIALSGLETTVFVKQDGSTPSYRNPQHSGNAQDMPQNRYGFDHGKLNGIEGTLYCDHSSGCVTSGGGLFGDGWYFTPDVNSSRQASLGYNPAEASFEDSDNDGTYDPVSYVDYGMWLEGPDNKLLLQRRAGVVGPSSPPRLLDFTTTDGLNTDTSATYEGEARGLSALTTGTGADAVTASGHFEADVTLNATFGPKEEDRTLGGTIYNFRPVAGQQHNGHVDPEWSLTLNFADLTVDDDSNKFFTSPRIPYITNNGGSWNATPYGFSPDGRLVRPDGFYGGFNATFRNDEGTTVGAAAGVYSAEKQ